MRLGFLLTIFAFSSGLSHGQIEGRFMDHDEFIDFRNGMAEFEVFSNGGLIVQLRGIGKYEVMDNYLLIHTVADKNLRQSSYDTIRSTNSAIMTFVDEQGNPIVGVNVTWLDKSRKVTDGKTTSENGTIAISHLKAETIRASLIGYDDITINLTSGFDYKVTMVEGKTLEEQTIVFKLVSSSNDALEVKLLTDKFVVRHSKKKDLARLERNSEDLRLRRFLK